MNGNLAEVEAGLESEASVEHDDPGNGTIVGGGTLPLSLNCTGCGPLTCPTCTNRVLDVVPCACVLPGGNGTGLPGPLGSA